VLLLQEVGFTNAKALKGGFDEWLRLGGRVEMK
jgi:rhodanese-related sulfurtransferase